MESLYTYTENGKKWIRIKNDYTLRKVDIERLKVAEKLGVKYLGVMEYRSPNGYNYKPVVQSKVLISLCNGTVLAMSANTFMQKEFINKNCKKLNSFAEKLVCEHLISNGISFFREVSLLGYKISEKYKEIESSLSETDLNLLKNLERAVSDFVIYSENEPTLILAINGSNHHKKYDDLWKTFQTSGLAEKLGYDYKVVDVSDYGTVKYNQYAQIDLLEQVSSILNIDTPSWKKIWTYEEEIAIKDILSILDNFDDDEKKRILTKIKS